MHNTLDHQQRSEKACKIWQEKCPKSKPRANGGKQAAKVLSRVCAGQRQAARDVYSYGKDKHQTISKCGSAHLFAIKARAYISMNMSCTLLINKPVANGALSRINPQNCSNGTSEHQDLEENSARGSPVSGSE